MPQQKSQSYWQSNLALIRNLLLIWAFVAFGAAIVLAKLLMSVSIGQLPLGFWIAQQGTLLSFIALIFVYAFKMMDLDRNYDGSKDDPELHMHLPLSAADEEEI